MTGMKSFNRAVAVAMLAAGLAGCTMSRDGKSIEAAGTGLEARLASNKSAASGVVRLFDSRDGVSFQMSLFNLPPGTYRVALHEKGNCRSPNLFSAGPAWAPPGSGKTGADLLPQFVLNTEGDMPSYVAFIPGARTEGPTSLRGRLVVVYFGESITDAFPGQPNNRLACGTFESVSPLLSN
jgi:Cu-Zn family superoxide dismutase